LAQHLPDISDREDAKKAPDTRTNLKLGPSVFVELRYFIDRHLRLLGQELCSFEVALVLFRCELAGEKGQKKLLQLLLLADVKRLVLMNQQHGVCEGIAHRLLPFRSLRDGVSLE
jgi:hypothetical protein